MPTLFGLNPFCGFGKTDCCFRNEHKVPNMPVLTRSNVTGPTRTMAGIKRKFIEILDSDDETSTVCSDSDLETEDEDELTNNALVELLIQERERTAQLTRDLEEADERILTLKDNIRDIQTTTWIELLCFICVVGTTFGTTLSALYACNIHENSLLTI